MINCYACNEGNYVKLHACSLKPAGASHTSFSRLADAWRTREDAKALNAAGEQVCYRVGDKLHDTMPAAVRTALAIGSIVIWLRRWWPRTDDGAKAARKAVHWCEEPYLSFKRLDYARTLTGPKNYVEEEI